MIFPFFGRKTRRKNYLVAHGAELVLRPRPLLGGGLGVGRIVNAGAARKKIPDLNQGYSIISFQLPILRIYS